MGPRPLSPTLSASGFDAKPTTAPRVPPPAPRSLPPCRLDVGATRRKADRDVSRAPRASPPTPRRAPRPPPPTSVEVSAGPRPRAPPTPRRGNHGTHAEGPQEHPSGRPVSRGAALSALFGSFTLAEGGREPAGGRDGGPSLTLRLSVFLLSGIRAGDGDKFKTPRSLEARHSPRLRKLTLPSTAPGP